ncbi:MAG: c-type cytochrome [Usitatibacter sp.]
MAEHEHHHDPIEDNIETHPVKLAIGVVIGAAALIVGILLLAQFAVGSHGARSMTDNPAMSPEAVAKRLAPVAQLVIDPNAPAAAPAAAAAPTAVATVSVPPPTAGAAPPAASGKSTFDSVCTVCHGTGVAGAPKFGDKAAWAPRIKSGIDALHASALKGKGAMPPKGGNPALSDADVKAAVDYMVAAAK